jgi:selenocysteine lyase/cysteine desulfurase
LRSRIDLERIGGTICLDLGDRQAQIMRALQAQAVRVDYRGSVLRLSFHIYNTGADASCIARSVSQSAV